MNQLSSDFELNGFALIPGILTPDEQEALRTAIGTTPAAGRRGMLAVPEVATIANSPKLMELVRSPLTPTLNVPPPHPVRAIAFDKSPDANWLVAWHQDLTIAVAKRCDLPGFGPWSVKDGVAHVQPPVELLEQMIAVRLHLDAADESNGALRVLPNTHRLGRIAPEQIETLRRDRPVVVCSAAPGDALLMRPLLLHASSRSTTAARRRVLHIEYAAFALPNGLAWNGAA